MTLIRLLAALAVAAGAGMAAVAQEAPTTVSPPSAAPSAGPAAQVVAPAEGPAMSQPASPFTPEQVRALEPVIRDYLMNNPRVLVDALEKYQRDEQAAREAQAQERLTELRPQLLSSPQDLVLGNPNGDVTIVEFFDYNCGYCKRAFAEIQQLTVEDPQVRVVMKEFPILGPASTTAARAAIASAKQGKYAEFHTALMTLRGQLSDEEVFRVAGTVGLDVERLRQDMNSPEVQAEIDRVHGLAEQLNVRGTPGFIVGREIVPGYVELAQLRTLIAEQRAGAATAPATP